MKNEKVVAKRKYFLNSVFLVLICIFTLTGCEKSSSEILAERIAKMESNSNNPGKTPQAVQSEIDEFKKDYDELFAKYDKITTWYKALGLRFMDKKAYREAYNAFHEAAVRSGNANYWRLAGFCSMKMAESQPKSSSDKKYYFENSIDCYKQALVEDSEHLASLKELGFLYTEYMNDGVSAITYLEHALKISTRDSKIMLNLAQAYYQAGFYEKSVEMYDKVIDNTTSEEFISLALENKMFVYDNYLNAKR